jgi:cytoskeletal protein CcmA (bactofilin family)
VDSRKNITFSSILIWLKEHIMGRTQQGLSIIDKGCQVEGTLNIKGKLIVAGSLKGTFVADTLVTAKGSRVDAQAKVRQVDAQAKVRQMIIGGECQGDITVYENLRILSTGVFSGNMICKNIELEAGGKIDGRVRLIDSTEEPSSASTILATNRVNPTPPTG